MIKKEAYKISLKLKGKDEKEITGYIPMAIFLGVFYCICYGIINFIMWIVTYWP